MSDSRELIHKIIFITKTHHSVIEKNIKDIGMHRSMHMVLRYLSECMHTPSQKSIAEHFKISAAAVAATLQRLENEGYIEKVPSNFDRRANVICVTKKGQKVLEHTHETFSKVDNEVFSGLSEEELCDLDRYLDIICKNLSVAAGDPNNDNGEKE